MTNPRRTKTILRPWFSTTSFSVTPSFRVLQGHCQSAQPCLFFGLGHEMGRFASFIQGSTQPLHHFLESEKVAKKSKI